jgi:hypothetical protein
MDDRREGHSVEMKAGRSIQVGASSRLPAGRAGTDTGLAHKGQADRRPAMGKAARTAWQQVGQRKTSTAGGDGEWLMAHSLSKRQAARRVVSVVRKPGGAIQE